MFKKPLMKEIFWLSALVAIMHYAALKFFFYWTISWFDIVMHLMGGFVIGLIVISILINIPNLNLRNNSKLALVLVLSFVMIIGLGWELWELFMEFSSILEDKVDTIIDLIMDFIGGYFAFLYANKYLWNKN